MRGEALGEIKKHRDLYPRLNRSEMVIATGHSGMLHGDTGGKQEKKSVEGLDWAGIKVFL